MAEQKPQQNVAQHGAPTKPTPSVAEMVSAIETASLCDGMHPAGKPGCRDCARRLDRQSALLLLAALPPADSIAALLADVRRFRLNNPMAWPSIEQANSSGLARALEMSGAKGKSGDHYRNAADALGTKLKAA